LSFFSPHAAQFLARESSKTGIFPFFLGGVNRIDLSFAVQWLGLFFFFLFPPKAGPPLLSSRAASFETCEPPSFFVSAFRRVSFTLPMARIVFFVYIFSNSPPPLHDLRGFVSNLAHVLPQGFFKEFFFKRYSWFFSRNLERSGGSPPPPFTRDPLLFLEWILCFTFPARFYLW